MDGVSQRPVLVWSFADGSSLQQIVCAKYDSGELGRHGSGRSVNEDGYRYEVACLAPQWA